VIGARAGTNSRVGARARSTVLLAGVLLLAGFGDGISDNWVHGALLGCAALAVWWDGASRPTLQPASPRHRLPPGLVSLLAMGAVAYIATVGALQRYTWPMTVAVVAPGIAALVLAWRGPLRTRPVPAPQGLLRQAPWAVWFVAGGLWELAALLMQPSLEVGSYAHPTISYLMDGVLASWPGRSIVLAGWLALGWFLLGRATGERE
jgi:hypothetical protein